jgi:uncharacterized membrane protein YdjX (TVP38/TMEM64 family)
MQTEGKHVKDGIISETGTDRFHFWLNLTVLVALAIVFALAYFLWPGFGAGLRYVFDTIYHGDLEGLKIYIKSFGVWAPAIAGLIMILQAIVAPLPAFVPALANGLLFGAFWGTLLTWSTSIIGGVICFYIARSLGRPAVEKLVSRRAMDSVDRFFKRYGNNSVLVARFIPLLSFSAISYLSGVTSIGFWGYFWATALGILPGTIVFCVLGQNITSGVRFIWYAVMGIAALIVLGFSVKQALNLRIAKQEQQSHVALHSKQNSSGINAGAK